MRNSPGERHQALYRPLRPLVQLLGGLESDRGPWRRRKEPEDPSTRRTILRNWSALLRSSGARSYTTR